MKDQVISFYNSPIGTIEVKHSGSGISSLIFVDEVNIVSKRDSVFENCFRQLTEYFEGSRTQFDIELDLQGTEFQKKVWKELLRIEYGRTNTYSDLARGIGNLKSIRAVGKANGSNPLSIIVPCHRVIGSDGSLTGYAGGLWRKQWLLDHEHKHAQLRLF